MPFARAYCGHFPILITAVWIHQLSSQLVYRMNVPQTSPLLTESPWCISLCTYFLISTFKALQKAFDKHRSCLCPTVFIPRLQPLTLALIQHRPISQDMGLIYIRLCPQSENPTLFYELIQLERPQDLSPLYKLMPSTQQTVLLQGHATLFNIPGTLNRTKYNNRSCMYKNFHFQIIQLQSYICKNVEYSQSFLNKDKLKKASQKSQLTSPQQSLPKLKRHQFRSL